MNILCISDFFPPFIKGGAEISTAQVVNILSKHYKFYVLTKKYKKEAWEIDGIEVYPLLKDYPSLKGLFGVLISPIKNFIKNLQDSLIIKRIIEEKCIDLIYISKSDSIYAGILAKIISKRPLVIDVRDTTLICPRLFILPKYNKEICSRNCFSCLCNPINKKSKLIEMLRPIFISYELLMFKLWNLLLKKVDKFVAISQFIEKQLIKSGIPRRKINIIYNISEPLRINFKLIKRENKIIFAGRIEKYKGIWDAIKAFELVNNRDLKFEIVGEGPELEAIKKYIRERNIKNIKIFNKVSNNKVLNLYRESKAIIAPSTIPEAFGRFIQEGISTRTPVIATKVGGIPEGIKDHETGLLVEPNNPKQLAKAIKELLTDKKLYNKIVKNLEKEADKYSPEKIGKQRVKIYEELIKINNKNRKPL